MMKGSFHQEYVTTINIHSPNNWGPKYMKSNLKELMGERDNSIVVEDFNTQFK